MILVIVASNVRKPYERTMPKRNKIQDSTLDSFDEILNDGTLGASTEKARQLVEDNPGKTAKELLRNGYLNQIYKREDRNAIGPRLTMLAEDGVIIRPSKRKCTITGKTVFIHELAPESWRLHRKELRGQHKGPYVKNRIETVSKSRKGVIHTTVEWTDGTVSCTCNELYHRSKDLRCHHAKGMIQAMTGKQPGEEDWKAMYNTLMKMYANLRTEHTELTKKHNKLVRSF